MSPQPFLVWRAIANDGGTDYDIFYTNNSGDPNDNIIRVTDTDASDEDNPDIEVLNGTVFIVFEDGTNVYMKTNSGGNSIGSSGSVTQVSQGA